jgi:Tol biopolymer transport system component
MNGPVSATVGGIFISYRRQETAFPAGWLYDRLRGRFGPDQVFKDVDNIEPGDDFTDKITTAVGSCDVLLALIGQEWLTITDDAGKRRLDDPEDFVRVEVEAALSRKVRVIPLLIDGAPMPRADQLPQSLARLVRRQAQDLSPSRFDADANRLVGVLERTLAEARAQREAEEQARRQSEQKERAAADERAQREAEEKARVQRESEEEARREAQARARPEAEALAQTERESEEKARRDNKMITGPPVPVPRSPSGEQPVPFSRGTASVPGTTPSIDTAPTARATAGSAPVAARPTGLPPGPPIPGTNLPGGEHARRGNSRKLVKIGAAVAALLTAGTVAAVALVSSSGGDRAGGPASRAVSAPADTPAPPYPTDPMLTRIDTGDAWPKSRTTIAMFTPGTTARTTIPGTAGHVLPQWSHDRTRIATTRIQNDGYSVWVMNADGSHARQVVDQTMLARVAWSPDDTTLAFMRTVDNVAQIFTIVIGQSTPQQLTHSKASKDDPAWSPDGKRIMYWTTVNNVRQICLLSVDHPQERVRQVTSGAAGPVNDPSWSPDGKTIAYTHITGDAISDIWLIDADGRNARQLTHDPEREMDATWSPDGTWIGFVRGSLGAPKITIIKADGSQEYTLTRGAAREGHPSWS